LKLWSKDKTENLRKFEKEWRSKLGQDFSGDPVVGVAPPCLPDTDFGATTEGLPLQNRHFSPDSAPSLTIEVSSSTAPSGKGRQGGISTVGLENIAEILVWVGRDALIQELKAKLLAPETAPKVLAIIRQGGIGKTSLAVKLLESLGVQLQPPNLTETCVYEKVLYFKVYPGTSFDSVAEFLLRGLDMETVEPLKTPEEKIRNVLEELTKQRGIVVLDNLEDILHPASDANPGKALSEEWGQLLHRFVYGNHRSTIMLTSREFPVDLADPRARNPKPDPKLVEMLTLVGVEDEAGVEILRQRGSADSEPDKEWIAERVKGNTFLLTQLAAIGLESPGYLRKHPELVTEEAKPILQAQLMRQSEAARDLLRQMCVLRTGIDIPGLTFLRLYTDDREKDSRFEMAVELEKPAELTKAELKETEEIVRHLVNSSLVQGRYDKERCEWFYDLHRLIVEYLQTAYQAELPQLMEPVYKFYCTGKTVENPKTLEDLRPLLEAQYFAFQLGNAEKSYRQCLEIETELGDRAGMAYSWGKLGENELGKGNLDAAEKYLREALADMEKLGMTQNIAETNFDLAKLWRQQGNEEIAQQHYEKSHQLYEKLGAMKDLERIEREWRETGFLN
jgi:hypothetical protein